MAFFEAPVLTPARVRSAYAVAVAVDLLQFIAGPVGWAFMDEILDVVAMGATWKLLGFHPLLLPTFALEFLPVSDVLPTWTGCVALVIAMRKRHQAMPMSAPSGPAAKDAGEVIDVNASRVE